MKNQSKAKSIIMLVLIIAATAALMYLGIQNMGNITLGLDLNGGVSITYQTSESNPSAQDMSDTIYKLQKRAENYSTEAAVYQEGSDRINIDIPGVTDANEILAELGKPGSLSFREGSILEGDEYMSYGGLTVITNDEGNMDILADEDGNVLLSSYDRGGNLYVFPVSQEVLTGSDVKDAGVYRAEGQNGAADSYEVQLILNDEGVRKFADATSRNIGRPIAIVYDNSLVSAPIVNDAITGGTASISGNFDIDSAQNLASTIRLGALKLELTELRSNTVGARLGQSAIETSIKAAIVGLIIIFILMIVLYRAAGVAASVALTLYTGLILILLDAFDVTLTLSGIAGIILSIGMAVDANVIIFTRIKEELGLRRTVAEAIDAGFHKALSAILDGNITTLIAAAVLYIKGSGTVKGFAQTLALGIILSMVTAIFVTRWLLKAFYGLGMDKAKFFGTKAPVEKPIDFVSKKKIFYIISGTVIALGIVFFAIKGFNYGLDFSGGTTSNVTFNEDMTLEEIQTKVVPVVVSATGEQSPEVSKVSGTNEVLIRTKSLDADTREKLSSALADEFNVDVELITSENISGSISSEMKTDALVAIVIAVVLMLLYIWFRFKNFNFAASAVLALVHDVLIMLTMYVIFRWSVGSTFIACILTIVGYSINATIVIFDRIRENMKLNAGMSREGLVNQSITETLTRSIFTSLTTFIMVAVLYVLGVSSVREFALPLMIGVVAGCYSSVCVTGNLWLEFVKKAEAKKASKK
ncbi:MAG: protein translocase subunit SecD [Lachnospiraceae bacterium]|nr:protein translocase subunit SecD [Lachnospiraceae bacterium]